MNVRNNRYVSKNHNINNLDIENNDNTNNNNDDVNLLEDEENNNLIDNTFLKDKICMKKKKFIISNLLRKNVLVLIIIINFILQISLFIYFLLILDKVQNIKLPNITDTEINKLTNIIEYICGKYVKC